jgi:mannose-1-phosphate guanylyltransferase
VIALPADHFVADPAGFRSHLAAACAHAEAGDTVATLGIEPSRPDTGYGYMERAAEARANVDGDGGISAYRAVRFVEKPDLQTARGYLETGRFFWNAGIFAMPVSRIERDFARLCPDAWTALREETPQQAYANIEAAPIDVAVMERLADIVVVPADVGWSDLGSWESIAQALPRDDAGNVVRTGDKARTAVVDATNCLVWNEDATVGVLGVTGLAVVAVGGRVLVCPLDQAQRVRAVVDALAEPEPD